MIREKILGPEKLAEKLHVACRKGQKTVFTNGCFDILHAGHVLFLEEARALGDLLVVGLNSDRSIGEIKGPTRPIVPEDQRSLVMAALESVDYVCLFDEPTPLELIRLLKPDILVKGDDWRDRGVVGREEIEARGGRVVLLPLAEGLSTSGLIDRIKNAD